MIKNEGQPSHLAVCREHWPTSDHRADGLDDTSR